MAVRGIEWCNGYEHKKNRIGEPQVWISAKAGYIHFVLMLLRKAWIKFSLHFIYVMVLKSGVRVIIIENRINWIWIPTEVAYVHLIMSLGKAWIYLTLHYIHVLNGGEK